MIHVLLADLPICAGHQVTRWPTNLKLTGKPVRIVFDDEKAMLAVLRGVCAADARPVELLDIDLHRWGFVFYDNSRVRKSLHLLNRSAITPEVLWLPGRNSALWLIGRLTGATVEG